MACRVRVLHFIILGLFGMTLFIYNSYFPSPGLYGVQNDVPVMVSEHAQSISQAANAHAQLRDEHPMDNTSLLIPEEVPRENLSQSPSPNLVPSVKKQVTPPVNSTLSSSSPSTPANIPHALLVSIANISEHTATNSKSAVYHVQQVPSKVSSPASATKSTHAQDSTEKGIATRSIYQSGHVIPNLELCPDLGSHLQVIILITSAPNHKDARQAIRQTWGHFRQRVDVNIAFLLGSTQDVKLHKSISEESAMYGDIVYANFVDTYNNLTLKTVSMLEWVDLYCNRAKFVLKTDDDMFINVPVLLNFIAKHSKTRRTIFGRLAKKWKPIRVKKSKYYVSPRQYRPAAFPNFTTGPAYLITGDAIHDLYKAALDKTYLKLEDVYITGIVAQDVNIKRLHVNEFFNKRITFNPCNIQKGISIHMIKFHEQFDLWKKLLDGRSKCP